MKKDNDNKVFGNLKKSDYMILAFILWLISLQLCF